MSSLYLPVDVADELRANTTPRSRYWTSTDAGSDPGEGSRRWAGAKTHRLNQHQWLDAATEQTINDSLAEHLDDLRTRASLEAERNSTVKGMLLTHVVDMIGTTGPQLHVESKSARFNDWAEAIWRDYWNPTDLGVLLSGHTGPDFLGKHSGPDFLSLWIKSCWKCGEFLLQFITDPDAPGPIKLRINSIHPRRIGTPTEMVAQGDVVLGVQVSDQGKPLGYYIGEPDAKKPFVLSNKHTHLPAADARHCFITEEDLQLRGIPWLATALQDAADLRQYDGDVLDAADQAAAMGVTWYSDHPDAPFLQVNESTSMRPRQQYTGPPGWKPFQINASQPSAQYTDFRKERKADLGRPVSMPSMIVRLTAERHTYSSARLDMKMYERALAWFQAWLGRSGVLPIVVRVLREAELIARAKTKGFPRMPKRPERGELHLTWPRLPHVDPKKERDAERVGLENGTLPFAHACAAEGLDVEQVLDSLDRTNQILVSRGYSPIPGPMEYLQFMRGGMANEPGGGKDDDDSQNEPDDKEGDDAEE